VAQEDLSIRFKVNVDAGNAISEAEKTADAFRDVAKAGGEVALAEKSVAAAEYAQQQRAFQKQNQAIASTPDIADVVKEAAIGRAPAQSDKPTPDIADVVKEAAIGRAPAQSDKPTPDIADGVRALEDALSSIESAKQRSMDRGDLSSARKYEQLYVSTNRQYRSEMGDYENESTNFEKITAERDVAEQERKIADTAESKASDEKSLKDKEYNDATDALKAAREEAKRTDKIAAEEAAKAKNDALAALQAAKEESALAEKIAKEEATKDPDSEAARNAAVMFQSAKERETQAEQAAKNPDSEGVKNAAKVAKTAEKNATQAEQAAEKASLAAAAAEEKYTMAKQKAAKAAQDAEAKQAALEKAAEQRRSGAAEHALRLGNIAADAHAGKKAIGVKAQEEEDETHKDQLTRTIHGISKVISRGSGYIGQVGSGNIAGAALGAAGDATGLLSLVKGLGPVGVAATAFVGLAAVGNKLSEQWEKVMQPSMALTASLGELSDDAHRNSLAFRDVFARATDSSVLHGYTHEEGLALANQMAKLGVGGTSDVISAEEQVFRWQRETDADRGTLAQAVGMAGRYRGGENVLGYVAGGLKESGMYSGQYQEYLSATLRIFEEGLSRGVVKGFDQITRTQNMLAQIGTTWQGEQGAEKYQRMEDAVTRASDLQSEYDTIIYMAAQSLMKQGKEEGDSKSYVDVAKVLDKGLTTELLDATLKIMSRNAGGDSQTTILQIMKGFGLSATSAEEVYKFWQKGEMTQAKERIEGAKSGGAESHEMTLLNSINDIKTDVALLGSNFTDHKAGVLAGIAKITGLLGGDTEKELAAHDAGAAIMTVGGAAQKWASEVISAAFQKDKLGSGGYADNVVAITNALTDVGPAIQNKIAHDPRLNASLFRGLDEPNDEAVAIFKQRLSEIKAPVNVFSRDVGIMGFGQEWNTAATRTNNTASQQYAASVWDRYGSLSEYKKSQEYKDMQEALDNRKRGGLTEAEIKEAADIAIWNYQERLQGKLDLIGEHYGGNLGMYAKPSDEGFGTLQDMLKAASELPGVSESIITKVDEAFRGATATSSSSGAVIDSGEIRSLITAIYALIPALKENAEFDVEVRP
jgi:hypothetical protein